MNFINHLTNIIYGDTDKISLEKRIFTLVCFLSVFISIISTVENILFDFNKIYIILIASTIIINSTFYYFARFKGIYLQWIFIAFIIAIFSISWFFNNGHLGSANYLYIMSLIVLLSFLKKKFHFFIITIVILNVFILNFLSLEFPDLVQQYPSEKAEYSKLISTLFLVMIFSALIFTLVKGSLEKEREHVERQKIKISTQARDVKEGVKYASVIQQAIFNQERTLRKTFFYYFILWKPRDDVSGDFYWVKNLGNKVVVAVADCTGHGVSAAFLSIMGQSFLNEIVKPYLTPGEILNRLRRKMKKSLHQTNADEIWETKDGMDISLAIIDLDKFELEFSGAFLSLYLIRKIDNENEPELIELKGDKQPVGVFLAERDFNNYITKLFLNDCIYMFSDGYYDQFGGKRNSKYLSKNFKKYLIQLQENNIDFNKQKDFLDHNFEKWRGKNEQIDDVLVLGFKISK